MNSKIKLRKAAGSAPSIVNSESLFDVLLGESESISEKAKDVLNELREALVYGGEKPEVTIEHADYSDQQDVPPDSIFDVLALDVATIFPSQMSSGNLRQSVVGRQICWCKDNESANEQSTWYSRALQEYFSTPPYGSLLTFPGIEKNLGRWWLLEAARTPLRKQPDKVPAQPSGKPFVWKDKFDPIPTPAQGHDFRDRFDQFGAAVFKELTDFQSEAETASTVVIWMYVGSLAETSQQNNKQPPLWGVSLFAVIKPENHQSSSSDRWIGNTRLHNYLLKAVQHLYLYLSAAAYKRLEHLRLMHDKREFQMNVAQAVAHEFKNLTQDISSLGSFLDEEFSCAVRELDKQIGQDSIVARRFSQPLNRLYRLSLMARLTSSISFATYWLTTPDDRHRIVFKPDVDCQVFQAATHLMLEICKETREGWDVERCSLKEAREILARVYRENDPRKLVERLDVALLLFVVSEPVKNLRSGDPSRKEVVIHTEVRDQTIYIYQKTYEAGQPCNAVSTAAGRINRLLQAGSNLSGKFAELDENIYVNKCTPLDDGYFEVIRETRIKVFGIPYESGR